MPAHGAEHGARANIQGAGTGRRFGRPSGRHRNNALSPVQRERTRSPRCRNLSPIRDNVQEQEKNKNDPMLDELTRPAVIPPQQAMAVDEQVGLQNKLVAFLEQVFQPVPAPVLPTPARRTGRGRALKKSPVKFLDGGRKSERLAKKTTARLKPGNTEEKAQEVLMKKAGCNKSGDKQADDDAKAKYLKLFKQPLTPQIIEAFSALVVGNELGAKTINVK